MRERFGAGSSPPIIALVALVVGSACSSTAPPADDGTTCAAYERAHCEGTRKIFCTNEGQRVSVDCAESGLGCFVDSRGIGDCAAARCERTGGATCVGDVLSTCDGELDRKIDCAASGLACGYGITNTAACTRRCPSDVDALGRCEGFRLQRCDGGLFLDIDCSEYGLGCGRTADGAAYCGVPCPEGASAFGVCTGTKLSVCTGELFVEVDCADTDQTCGPIGRYGVACRGCEPSNEACDGDVLHACRANGTSQTVNCAAAGGHCSASSACAATCTETKSGRTCIAEGLTVGQARCVKHEGTGFSGVARCRADGTVTESECGAAADDSVSCVDAPEPHCVSSVACSPNGQRCTDRGVLLSCADPEEWTDCGFYGGTCSTDSAGAFCACTALPPEATRCIAGTRATCTDGRITFEACTC